VAPGGHARVWCDASSLAVGCALESDGEILEDAAWLRKKSDGSHINMAELDAVVNGLNLAVKWQVTDVEIITDSASVFSWLRSTLLDSHKIRTHGMSEMLVKRRLQVIKELCTKFGMSVSTLWVPTTKNKADGLTRVRKRWLDKIRCHGVEDQVESNEKCCVAANSDLVAKVHGIHHFGVNRTLFFARLDDSAVTRADVQEVVSRCSRCKSVDPAPMKLDKGDLEAEDN
jgi:ribonuclease HI